ncbi:MAG: hypothetical protein KDA88_21405 [Planctomycetaceae bacterium]|nr:hypothetical protein [Planctomycetaceae bacterium]
MRIEAKGYKDETAVKNFMHVDFIKVDPIVPIALGREPAFHRESAQRLRIVRPNEPRARRFVAVS